MICDKHGIEKIQRIRGSQKAGWYCRKCANEKSKAYRLSAPEAYLNSKLWTFYRIRLADLRRMLAEQGGACKVCRKTPAPSEAANGVGGTGLVIDHDHSCCPSTRVRKAYDPRTRICGKCIRGLLCQQCNVALGMANDDPKILAAMIEYLAHSVHIQSSTLDHVVE